ncbi:4'-phosphopantetheinyl transferase family protein [Glaciimonas soli]|uniref:4'-phosphopantetheinyl transferase superfamily protein n=1 Tax=Glaciimonas soli TaxID=2590999 RepID=A0A843YMR0_9BURK|nr:4'-phosphopantetheinyl transferase superfamily protein [Glaciimonas soli]MQR01159.1 4'-phosphopantetheinyl transferase superfamily protein [Glaciimonas soli]
MMRLELDTKRIDLWCAFPAEITDESLLQTYRDLLSDEERVQQQRFYFAKDRQRYLVTRVLARTVLSRYGSVAPEQWVFAANAYGKPHINFGTGLDKKISFNITHADNLIIIAVTCDHALGLDTENNQDRSISQDLAEHSFAPEEVVDFCAQPADQQQQRFFEYWTLKESYIKARGMGLSIPLQQFSFSFPREDEIALALAPELNDTPARWRFWQFKMAGNYLVALCAEKVEPEPPSLIFKQVVPLVSEQEIDYQLLRVNAA